VSDDHMHPERDWTSGSDITAHDHVAGRPLRLQTRGPNPGPPMQPPGACTAVFAELPLLTLETYRLPREIRHQSLDVSINCLPGIAMQFPNPNRVPDDDVSPVGELVTDGRNPPMDGEFPDIRNR
jgi:hypothetical protein